MNVPISWLKQYVDIESSVEDFADAMTMTGSKVEAIEKLGNLIENVLVGRVESIEQHQNADKLVVTQINIGKEENIQIVTGATNLFVGAYVPVVLDGGVIADGRKIKKGKLRGEVSNGMLCSIEELGYDHIDYPEASSDGIYIFKEEQELGADVREILELCDEVVEFEITSNRADCYSVIGLAREAAATYRKELRIPKIEVKEVNDDKIDEMIDIKIENEKLCSRYIARVVKNVKIEPSPQWLRHRLTAAGLKPINNIVDITNYVMLELGQPMHAFDIQCVSGGEIIVRNAKQGEKIVTLDGIERKLDESMLVIADREKAIAVAGVMGGENSKIGDGVNTVLFESASFEGTNVRLTSKKLGIRTDASSKYEKGLDPNLAEMCVNRAVQLVEMLECGEVVKGMVDVYPAKRVERKIAYNPQTINKLLGTDISKEEMEELLKLVGIESDESVATIPTFRNDIELEADIAEEIARLYGFENIQELQLSGIQTLGKKNVSQKVEDSIKNKMVSLGFYEILNYSFESEKVFERLNLTEQNEMRKTVKIVNPLGEDFKIMRTSLLNGILTALSTNYNHRNENVSLFELSKNYIPKGQGNAELPEEPLNLIFGAYGEVDFFKIKGILEDVFCSLGVANVSYRNNEDIEFLHTGRQAELKMNDEVIGYIGEVYPTVCDNYEIGSRVCIANVCISKILAIMNLERKFKALPKFPSSSRDLAILVKEDVCHADIESAIIEKSGKILESVKLFDVYKGMQVKRGYKSMAYKITFRADDRTLTDEEISKTVKKTLEHLSSTMGVELRS